MSFNSLDVTHQLKDRFRKIEPKAEDEIVISSFLNRNYQYTIDWQSLKTWIGGSGSTITGASNGLSLLGTSVILGGSLSLPTIINGGSQTLNLGSTLSPISTFATIANSNSFLANSSWIIGMNSSTTGGYSSGDINNSVLGFTDPIEASAITLNNISGAISGTNPLFKGLEYGADYSANNVGNPRWLIDQGFLTSTLTNYIPTSEKGAPNGVATLDASGKLPTSQLTVSAMEFIGTWDANSNSPALTAGLGNNGDTYIVNIAGSQDLGEGVILYNIGDLVIYNEALAIWQKVDGNSLTGVIVSADNGLTESPSGNVKLGGDLIENTEVNGTTIYGLDFKSLLYFGVGADGNAGLTSNAGLAYIQSNNSTAYIQGFDTEVNSSNNLLINGPNSQIQIWPTVSGGISISDGSGNNYMIINDNNNKGLVYNADYSANFTDNSLVTKYYVDNNILLPSMEQTHIAGATVTVSSGVNILYVNPVSVLAALTITLPASPVNGQELKVTFGGSITGGQVVTSLSIIGNVGHTILAGTAITSAVAGDGYIFKFDSVNNMWRIF